MAVFGGPNVIDNGLVLSLDAGNVKSYPGSGTIWYDKSGNDNNGTLTNGPTFSGGSIVFDGVDDYVRIPYKASLNPDTITVSTWANRSQNGFYSHIICLPINNTTWAPPYMSYGIEYISNTNTISFLLGFTDNNFEYTNVNLGFGNDQWFNFTGTYDKTNVKVYINGVLSATRAETRTIYQSTSDFYIGVENLSAQYELNGKIGITQIYNRALSAQEVLQNYNATKSRFNIT
jgi:hypothetical protein